MRTSAPAAEHAVPPEDRAAFRYAYITKQTIGQPFQGPSGRWYVRRPSDGHTVPAPAPGGATPSAQVRTPSGRVTNVPPRSDGNVGQASGTSVQGLRPGLGQVNPAGMAAAPQPSPPKQRPPLDAFKLNELIVAHINRGEETKPGHLVWMANELSKLPPDSLVAVATNLKTRLGGLDTLAGIVQRTVSQIKELSIQSRKMYELRQSADARERAADNQRRLTKDQLVRSTTSRLQGTIQQASNLNDHKKTVYSRAVGNVVARMPQEALVQMNKSINSIKWHADLASLNRSLGDPTRQVIGCYKPASEELNLDGTYMDRGTPDDADMGAGDVYRPRTDPTQTREIGLTSISGSVTTGIYAHEMTHAIDKGGGYSKMAEFQDAWDSEIRRTENNKGR